MTDTFELADNNGVRRFGGTAYAPGATPGDVFTVQADGSLAAEPGGGSQPVACVLARDAVFDIRLDSADTSVLWDALYDDLWNLDPLVAIPAGLGLTFAFDGSSSLIVPTEAGIWTFSYFAERLADVAWAGSFVAFGRNYPWVQQLAVNGTPNGTPPMAGTLSTPLPAGAQMTHQVAVENEANANPYTCNQVYLSIVRHA